MTAVSVGRVSPSGHKKNYALEHSTAPWEPAETTGHVSWMGIILPFLCLFLCVVHISLIGTVCMFGRGPKRT